MERRRPWKRGRVGSDSVCEVDADDAASKKPSMSGHAASGGSVLLQAAQVLEARRVGHTHDGNAAPTPNSARLPSARGVSAAKTRAPRRPRPVESPERRFACQYCDYRAAQKVSGCAGWTDPALMSMPATLGHGGEYKNGGLLMRRVAVGAGVVIPPLFQAVLIVHERIHTGDKPFKCRWARVVGGDTSERGIRRRVFFSLPLLNVGCAEVPCRGRPSGDGPRASC